jgi:hypothetical protein
MGVVNAIWSASNGGSAITSVDHGTGTNGSSMTAQEVFIRHDGNEVITDCGFYIAEKTGAYVGGASAAVDLAEMLAWGDASTTSTYGGFELNMDATNLYAGNWPTYSDKFGSTYNVFRTGYGDTVSNKILLPVEMGLTIAGRIPAGSTPNVRFRCRLTIPTNEGITGIREFEQRMRYTYTS